MSEKYTDIPPVVLPPPESAGRASNVPRTIGYTLAVLFWLACMPKLAADAVDPPGGGARFTGALIGTIGITFLFGLAIRFVYAKLRRRRVMSPWLFVIAALFALLSIAGGQARERERVNEAAVERGLADSTAAVTPVDRCVARMLDEADAQPAIRELVFPGGTRSLGTRICARAASDGVLTADGKPQSERAFKQSACLESVLVQFESLPRRERGFRRADFEIYGRRYCAAILQRGLDAPGTPPERLDAVAQQVLRDLVRSGQITPIR